jgi:hypothetical protein
MKASLVIGAALATSLLVGDSPGLATTPIGKSAVEHREL